ncbi:MAG: hypothetical protein PHT04_05380, partial [Eubacteriales bacterium]|nr:hypothetical protein [Eubacteriales bacterium]
SSITGTSESPTDSAATTVSEMITGESTILSAKPSSAAHVVETISTGRTDTSAEQTAEIPTASPVDPSVPPSGTSPFLIWLIAGGATVLLGGAAFFFIRKH